MPYVNLVLMAVLALLPTAPAARWRSDTPAAVLDERFKSALLGILISLAVTIPTVLLAVYFKRSYSAGLFLGTPFGSGGTPKTSKWSVLQRVPSIASGLQ